MFAISDMANEHFLTKEDRWLPKPINEDELSLLVQFETREEAESFCRQQIAAGCHCRSFALADQ
jgi:hypothetical protein